MSEVAGGFYKRSDYEEVLYAVEILLISSNAGLI